jgi:hypothetical protein
MSLWVDGLETVTATAGFEVNDRSFNIGSEPYAGMSLILRIDEVRYLIPYAIQQDLYPHPILS